MPIYEYHCQQCDADFEQFVRSARAKIKCPQCAGRRVRRKPSLFATSGSSQAGGEDSTRSSCGSCSAASCAGCRK
ncbi:MAG: zinc ribbon domain-containing protein [Sedimentisphaerales bacterium]|nr:zinc ribbon domain-containing protein [Sedimentisphaerales bacterium]